ncbi:hypothetical protein [uncultured Methanomethylovorans sp.]|uniref:hypothetical protein n=1 Tax=uncultured Methanomethylovorans sp. TaxID=183759 RepID=UPI002AA6F4E4|nr:hypothetical protein [uncultured Methanomethylovorans sp.]
MQKQVIIPVVLLIAFIISVGNQRYRFQKSGNALHIAAACFSSVVPPFLGVLERLEKEINLDINDTYTNYTECVCNEYEGISKPYTRNEKNVVQYFPSRKNESSSHYIIITKSENDNEFAFETTKTGVIKCNSSQVDVSILESQYF